MSGFGRGQTRQGRGDRGDAQAADRRLERGDSSQTLRAALARACPTRGSDEQGLMNSTVSCANATASVRRSGAE
jgi:hypothetical protein